jgi:hypothetical protein
MIAYTITAPLANGTSALATQQNSGSESRTFVDEYYDENGYPLTSASELLSHSGGRTHSFNANGKEDYFEKNTYFREGFSNDLNQTITYSQIESEVWDVKGETSPDGRATGGRTDSWNYTQDEEGVSTVRTQTEIRNHDYHVLAQRVSNNEYSIQAPNGGDSYTVGGYYSQDYGPTTFSQFFRTIALQTTTKTTVTNNYKVTTTTQEKLAKVGTTITQSVGTSVVTLPTTTNAKSWTENTTTNTTATEDATVVTTSMGTDSYWKKTAHTVYILGKGETAAFLKFNVALNATNGGPTDTAAYDTYSGPTTFTITRVAGTTSQKPVVADTATDTGFEAGEGSQSTETLNYIAGLNSEGVYYYTGSPHHFPLSSTNITIQTGASESSATFVDYKQGEGQWGANAKTTTRSAWGQTSVTYSLAGVSYTEGVPTYTEETYAQPIVRSGTAEGRTFGEQANYFVNFQNQGRQNNGGGADAFYGLAYAWGTLGGTTAEPYQSISVDGIDSSESVTWPFVSISAGVQTPKPFVTVSQIPSTSETSSTAATKTEITKRRIWGEEFAKTTSSRQTASTTSGTTITGTSGSTTTPIEAGGAAITSFQLGGARGFPVNQLASGWIPAPAMFVVGGIAQTNDSTAIIPPGEYANSTITAPQSFSGSSIANTYFLPKAARTFICSPS